MNLYKRFVLALLMVCFTGMAAFALTATGTKPSGVTDAEWQDLLDELNKEIEKIDDKPENLIRSFADASVFASHGATQRAYGEYKRFAFTIGAMAGMRLPGSPFSLMNTSEIGDTLEKDGDIKAGINIQMINAQFGLNTSSFLLEGLYLGVRFGYFSLNAIDDLTFKTLHIGLVGNYQIIKGRKPSGALYWRGLTVGTGFLFQKTTLDYNYTLDTITEGIVALEPKLDFAMAVTTFTIPLEINTSVQLLWVLNLSLGAGVDIAFGKNDVSIGMDSKAYNVNIPSNTGSITISGGGAMSPTILNPKLMFNLGFKFGAVVIDVPITYYISKTAGISAGITLGIVY
ncbi:hypothetical protein AGMMS50230_12350 [Spirochaetia bacterium]|nr:hypothetical protein AGMMS50230_12350 [Spirochaetia bacterium]